MADLVLAAPHPAVCRNRHGNEAGWTDDAGHYAKRLDVIVEMLKDVERGDQIETSVRKRNGLGSAVRKTHAGPPRHARGTAHVDIASGYVAEFEKGLRHRAASGTDVDDAGRRPHAGAE